MVNSQLLAYGTKQLKQNIEHKTRGFMLINNSRDRMCLVWLIKGEKITFTKEKSFPKKGLMIKPNTEERSNIS